MTFFSNDPSWWLTINFNLLHSYWIVAAGVMVVHDWVLTLGQEIELIWRQRWLVSHDRTLFDCIIAYYVLNGTIVALTVMLGVIMIARLHAMYQGSRTMLMFLIIIFLAVNIACGVIMAIILKDTVGEELILSGIYMCSSELEGKYLLLGSMVWMLNTVWEVLALCLSVWVAVKHFRELRRLGPSTGSTIGDCFRVLIQSHVLYFASFVGVSCVQLAFLFPELPNSDSIGVSILGGTLQICMVIQLFVLGPRLILSVRGYHAKLVAYSDAETSMNLLVFQEHVHVLTSSTV
ncbi:uncharacterized protein HD556DRAFT_1531850 [Suillus plorans]|uniref:DUF6533 domain-containing protein n=1 Tax=Suillus plorans TaxID=116603 RepID=A0A9P7A996_9AGAM|nr:uncharacterized protein HD556DRAFT_1531850 [Suillus plorans]KAG1784849.1 hypothetical protein HD556DRAFT_1531850 [Suillus plorans]